MRIEDFKRTVQKAEIDSLSEMQNRVLPLFYKVHPSCVVNEIRLDVDDHVMSILFIYKSESYVARVEYNYYNKTPIAWIEVFVAKFEEEIPDELVGSYPKIQDELEISMVIRRSQMIIGIANVEMDFPEKLHLILEDIYQKKQVVERLLKRPDMEVKHIEPFLKDCSDGTVLN